MLRGQLDGAWQAYGPAAEPFRGALLRWAVNKWACFARPGSGSGGQWCSDVQLWEPWIEAGAEIIRGAGKSGGGLVPNTYL